MLPQILPKEKFGQFVSFLMTEHKVVAPMVKGPQFAFGEVQTPQDAQAIRMNYDISILPLKKYLLPTQETLLEFGSRDPASASQVVKSKPRVILGAHELGTVRLGDIMVAPNTDSGWTPVFGLIGGLVVQTGGILSHAAIVAREYRIPAVTGLSGACTKISTGELIEVNGNTGRVTRVEGK